MNALARLGFLLLGIDGLLASLRAWGGMLADVGGTAEAGSGALVSGVMVVAFVLDFGPPTLLILLNRHLADFAFPGDRADSAPFSAAALLSAGVAVCGLYLAILGLSGLAGAAGSLAFAWSLRENPHFVQGVAAGSASGFARLALGAALYYFGPRVMARFGASTHAG